MKSLPTIITSFGPTLIVCYLQKKIPGVIDRHKITTIGKSEESLLVSVGSGLSSDGNFVNKLLMRDISSTWERYDELPECSRVSNTASRIMLAFMGYEDPARDGSIDVLKDENGDSLSIGRPLGLTLSISRLHRDYVEIQVVEPSGVISDEAVVVFGRGYDKGMKFLKEHWKEEELLTQLDLETLCIGTLRDIANKIHILTEEEEKEEKDKVTTSTSGYKIVMELLNKKHGLKVKEIHL